METVLRVTLFYLFILFGLRVLGKREFSQLSPLELVMLLLIPELASQSLVREDFSLTNGIIAITTVFTLVFVSSVLQHHSKTVARAISGSPTILVADGAFIQEHLNRERIDPGEVFSEMHKVGLSRLEQVRWAILETDGQIAIVPSDRAEMVQPAKKQEQQVQSTG